MISKLLWIAFQFAVTIGVVWWFHLALAERGEPDHPVLMISLGVVIAAVLTGLIVKT